MEYNNLGHFRQSRSFGTLLNRRFKALLIAKKIQ
jgi:hypothetical protein